MAPKTTKWQQIFDALEARIQSGDLRGKLPGYSKLGEEYGASVITISRVVRELERRGYVTIRPKSGATVDPLPSSAPTPSSPPRNHAVPVKRIAFLLPVALADPYWASVADGALSACWNRNRMGRTRWRLEVNYGSTPLPHNDLYSSGDSRAENMTAAESEAALRQEQQVILELSEEVDALMLSPRFVFDPDFYRSLFRRGTRVLTLDNKVGGVPCVASHSRRAAYKGITFLLLGLDSNQGRLLRRTGAANAGLISHHLATHSPRIYVFAESPHTATMHDRLNGCQEAMRDAVANGYSLPVNWLQLLAPVKNLSDYGKEAYTATLQLLTILELTHQLPPPSTTQKVLPHSPIAFFALTDRCALGIYQALQEKGYAHWTTPGPSVALLSYDNLWQNLEAYSISSLAQDPFHIGERGARLLFDMPHPTTFFSPGSSPPDEFLEVGLVQRNSTIALTHREPHTP